jgi:large subunit ribosomal protein L25
VELKLKAESRSGDGKGEARKLRASGRVPGVLYGHGMDPVHFAVDAKELHHLLHTAAGMNVLFDLEVDGKDHLVLPREIQRNHIRGQYIHVDLLTVRQDEKVTLSVPVTVVGESPGVRAGGVVEHHTWELQVECLPGQVPDSLEADISALEVGQSLHVSDVVAPEGVTILTNPEDLLVAVVVPQVRVVEEIPVEGEEGVEAAAEGEEGAEGAAEESGEG